MAVSFTWLGHSAFSFNMNGKQILCDPFLTGNPLAAADASTIPADIIVVSHGHGDHLGDTVEIAQRTGASVVCTPEIGGWLYKQGLSQTVQINTGGTYDAGFVRIKFTIAFHTSSLPDGSYGGEPMGLILSAPEGLKLYFAGDTALFGDMALIGDEGIDVAFLPIGDVFTMGIDDSLKAIQLIRPRFVVPMHYNTYPPLVQNVSEWATRVNNETSATPIVFDPGDTYTLS